MTTSRTYASTGPTAEVTASADVGTGVGETGKVAGAKVIIPAQGGSRAGLVRNVRVGRQGIYDAGRALLAYELLFRAYDGVGEATVAAERATSQVIASTFGTFGLDKIANGRPVFINFTRAFLTGMIPIPVEPAGVVIEVIGNVVVDDELIAGMTNLREAGYRIAICDYRGQSDRTPLLELSDYVKVDVTTNAPAELVGIVERVRARGSVLVATQVEDEETFTQCVALGFELFQGTWLKRPTVLERRTLSPSQLICVRLLNDLADPDAEISKIEQLVGTDPGLTMRLLRTANSAATGATREVTSLRQALVIIGPQRLRSWIVLTLMEGSTTTAASDGLWNVLARAFSCQRLGGTRSDVALTIGLLSGAAELLGVEPETVAESSGISDEARAALLRGTGEAGRALTAVLAHERNDDDGVAGTGLLPFDVSRAYLESLSESLKLVTDLNGA
jgi:EAL and modified HD-GYP domain-containing signal transduction protein